MYILVEIDFFFALINKPTANFTASIKYRLKIFNFHKLEKFTFKIN